MGTSLRACLRQLREAPDHPGLLLLAGVCRVAASSPDEGREDLENGFDLLRRHIPESQYRVRIATEIINHAERLIPSRRDIVVLGILEGDPSVEMAGYCYRRASPDSDAYGLAAEILEEAEEGARQEQLEEKERVDQLLRWLEAFVEQHGMGTDRERERLVRFLIQEKLIAEDDPQRSADIGLVEHSIRAILERRRHREEETEYELFKRRLAAIVHPAQESFELMSGAQFEEHIARCLEGVGARVVRTPPSKDYGVDLIVAYSGREIAVQVKRSSSPVGIQAVQEISAGQRHYACIEAAVLSNNSFTKEAEQLATTNKVRLITVADALELDLQLGFFLKG